MRSLKNICNVCSAPTQSISGDFNNLCHHYTMLKIVGSDLYIDVYRGQIDHCLYISFSVVSFSVWSSKTAQFFPSTCHIGFKVTPVKQTHRISDWSDYLFTTDWSQVQKHHCLEKHWSFSCEHWSVFYVQPSGSWICIFQVSLKACFSLQKQIQYWSWKSRHFLKLWEIISKRN